jgi:VanZ family protein
MVASALLEILQFLTPDRTPDLATVISGAGGAVAAALIAELFIRIRSGLRAKRERTR